jgi:hypothetical protein
MLFSYVFLTLLFCKSTTKSVKPTCGSIMVDLRIFCTEMDKRMKPNMGMHLYVYSYSS